MMRSCMCLSVKCNTPKYLSRRVGWKLNAYPTNMCTVRHIPFIPPWMPRELPPTVLRIWAAAFSLHESQAVVLEDVVSQNFISQ